LAGDLPESRSHQIDLSRALPAAAEGSSVTGMKPV
jgi:hypothetical protein